MQDPKARLEPCAIHRRPPDNPTEIQTKDFERFSTDLAMRIWNQINALEQFKDLSPKDYPVFYETVEKTLRPYWVRPQPR